MRSWEDYKKTMVVADDLRLAAKASDIPSLESLLALGHDLEGKDARGYSALMLAAYAGHVEVVQFLLSKGADPNTADPAGNTVLMGASFKGFKDIAKLLIDAGADVSAQNASKMDAYEFALTFGRQDIAKLLEESGMKTRRISRVKNFLVILLSRMKQTSSAREASASQTKSEAPAQAT